MRVRIKFKSAPLTLKGYEVAVHLNNLENRVGGVDLLLSAEEYDQLLARMIGERQVVSL